MWKYNRFSAKINQTVFTSPIEQKQWEEGEEVDDGHASKVHHAEKE